MKALKFLLFAASLLLPESAPEVLHHANSAANNFDARAIVAVKVQGRGGFCSGALISATEILTATHCVYDLPRQSFFDVGHIKIGLAENILGTTVDWLPIACIEPTTTAKITTENDYLLNDVVRLILAEPLSIRPLSIARTLDANSRLSAWGFGEDPQGYVGIRKARALENPSVEPGLIAFTAGACRGDSGGPVLDDSYQVVGLVSLSEVPHCVNPGRRVAQRVWKTQSISGTLAQSCRGAPLGIDPGWR